VLRLYSDSPHETEQLGFLVGSTLPAGTFIALQGDLGCGKTCFARGVVAAVAPESSHRVASPTYAIMNCYPGSVPVYHFDFYRLSGDDDVVELGFEEYFYGAGICIVEWSERLAELLPAERLTILFEYCGENDKRLLSFSAAGDLCDSALNRLANVYRQKKL